MSEEKLTFDSGMQEVLKLQAYGALLLGGIVVLVTVFLSGPDGFMLGLSRAFALMFGAGLGIFTTAITARVVLRSGRAAADSADNPEAAGARGMLPVYAGVVWKLLIVAGGAFVGMVYFDLRPLFLLLGFIIIQAGYISGSISVHARRRRKRRAQERAQALRKRRDHDRRNRH